ncbi:methyltransferase domain-containing protein [uncultured Winogradskyella sp.]|uniref:methyltransferase domain-containing protein n=1 Tax=uncultured Winogradskyella sp. TaxID=395353 RepID=UPI0035147221
MNKMLNKDYWKGRYESENTGWDIGYVSPALKQFVDGLDDKAMKILIPGAGNGYEVEYLWKKGFKNVYAADYAEVPLQNLKKRLTDFPKSQLISSNFFEINRSFDLVLEQTFFCALDPDLRQDYVSKMHDLLNPNGLLAGLLFNFPLTESGPPFGGSLGEYKNLFEPLFHLHKLETSYNSIEARQGKELFFIFEKKNI